MSSSSKICEFIAVWKSVLFPVHSCVNAVKRPPIADVLFFSFQNATSAALTSHSRMAAAPPTSFSVFFEAVLFRADSVFHPDSTRTKPYTGFDLSPCNHTTWLVVWGTVKSLPALNLKITCGLHDIMSKMQNLPRGDDNEKKKEKKQTDTEFCIAICHRLSKRYK